ATLTFAWQRDVPTLILAAERDRFTPLDGMYDILDRVPSSKDLLILRYADHDHFGDHIEAPLCPREHAQLFTRGLALAHLDAFLKEDAAARQFMTGDPAAELRARGAAAMSAHEGAVD